MSGRAGPGGGAERRLDWPGLMRAGLRGLALAPAEFWGLTPHELLVMLGKDAAAPPMGRARLEELGRLYPDRAPRTADDEEAGHG